MKLRTSLALWVCRTTAWLLRKTGRGATNLPGVLAYFIDRDILGTLAEGVHVTVITGTNGKTTTARMVEKAFEKQGYDYFANRSGANLITGIIAVFARHCDKKGHCTRTHAVIECDEASFREVARYLPVQELMVGNIFRDQLDRYGEITHTLSAIAAGCDHIPKATLCLNADCSLTASLAEGRPNPIRWFGANVPLSEQTTAEVSDALYCIRCKTAYTYDYHTYGHLGGFRCPHCGYCRPQPAVALTAVQEQSAAGSRFVLQIDGEQVRAQVSLPGAYNVYNALAAVTTAMAAGVSRENALAALTEFDCGFGRAEQLQLGQTPARLLLVKNPAGYNQVISLLAAQTEPCQLIFLLNDRYADGTDISWLWDIDFELLAQRQSCYSAVYVSGIRMEDMALRLKYAGFDEGRLLQIRDYEQLLDRVSESAQPAYFMPTYTAMFDLREAMQKRVGLSAFYE